jgi:hypothetical protein
MPIQFLHRSGIDERVQTRHSWALPLHHNMSSEEQERYCSRTVHFTDSLAGKVGEAGEGVHTLDALGLIRSDVMVSREAIMGSRMPGWRNRY